MPSSDDQASNSKGLDYLAALERDSSLLIRLCGENPDAEVVTCPGWKGSDLAHHLGRVYSAFVQLLAKPSLDAPDPAEIFGSVDDLTGIDLFAERQQILLDLLGSTNPETATWTWTNRRDAGFFFRRAAHETAVHLADMQLSLAMPVSLDPEMACDGIDEVFEVAMRYSISGRSIDYPATTLHLHRTDGLGEWMISAADGELVVDHAHGKGDAAVRGPASQLLLFMWGRGLGPSCELFGSRESAQAWAELVA